MRSSVMSGGISEISTINPSWFSLGPLRGPLARPDLLRSQRLPAAGSVHLRVNSYVVRAELLFTVLKLLWAVGGSRAGQRLARRELWLQ